jgi:hypothetical protein
MNFNFRLRPTPTDLDQILVKASRKPYKEQGDTIIFDVAAYSDGSERKIEDLIKKLPGITVNDRTGEIRYKGIPVETVNLDGDNLFDQDYTIGTTPLHKRSNRSPRLRSVIGLILVAVRPPAGRKDLETHRAPSEAEGHLCSGVPSVPGT